MEWLAALKLEIFPAYGLLALAVLLIFTGKLEWHTRSKEWKEAYLREQARSDELTRQNTQLIIANQTTQKLIQSLPKVKED